MQTIEINDQIAEQIKHLANKEHISTSQFIERLLMKYAQEKKPTLMTELMKDLPNIKAFEGDPVEIQRRMRDEWER